MKKYARLAGEPDFHPYDLRHAFATRLVEGGANIRAVQELLGHADLTTTAVYLGLAPKHLEEAIRRPEKTTERGKPEIDNVAAKQSNLTRPNIVNISNDPLTTALKVMVEPANLYQALKPENVEELQLNTMPIINQGIAEFIQRSLKNGVQSRKHK